MPEQKTSDYQAAFEAGLAGKLHTPGGSLAPAIIIPKGMAVHTFTEHAKPIPLMDFITGTVSLQDVQSFTSYVNKYKTKDTLIAIDGNNVRAALDYHAAAKPNRNQHFANFSLKTSEGFEAWKAIHEEPQSQMDFALFLEERAKEVTDPGSAAIMEIALTLEAKTEAQFTSAQRLNNLTNTLKWDEQTTTKAGGKGELDVPTQIMIQVPLHRYGQPITLDAKMRVVIRNGGAAFIIKLLGLEAAQDEATHAMIETITTATGITPLRGTL